MIVKTSTFNMDVHSYTKLCKLFDEYYRCKDMTGDEFIQMKLVCADGVPLSEGEIEKFVLIVIHKNFLSAVKNNIVSHYNLRNHSDVKIIMVLYVVLFASNQADTQKLFEVFQEMKCAYKNKILQYFWDENNLIQTALTGCKFFEDEYILSQIINPLLNNTEHLRKLDEFLYLEKIKKRTPKPTTVPDNLTVLRRGKRPPTAPLNTPVEYNMFQATEIPNTLYMPDNVEKRLMGEFEKNKIRAQKLLAQAKALQKNYCQPKKPVVLEKVPQPQFKAKKAPRKQHQVEIKGNVASVLREASRCVKEQEQEIKHIENIVQGGATLDGYRELERSVREAEHRNKIEYIERKHLEGLLTFEEAILAKRKLIECNKERFKEFMEEREQFLEQMEEWREREQEKMKEQVRKCQEIERNAKESEKRLKEERRNQADLFKDETRKLLQEAYEKQQQELAKKIKLIEEIKTLHQLKSLHPVKEFDPTDCPNLGLLCQMSIAELQEKLAEVKIRMEKQLGQKRLCIQKYKERQRKMIDDVKNFITQTRMSKPKRSLVPIRTNKLARNPELDKLRTQLDYAREQRRNNLQLDNIPCPQRCQINM